MSGATGEYSMASEQERVKTLEWIRAIVPDDRLLLAGVGAPDMQAALRLASRFQAAGADVLLTPTPHFFPYPPAEIEEYYRVFAAATQMPVLIYNLPSFTSGVPLSVVLRLIESVHNFTGRVIIQTLFFRAVFGGEKIDNTSDEELTGLIAAYKSIQPEKIMIYTFERDTAADGLQKIPVSGLQKIAQRLKKEGFNVEVSA